MASLKRRGNSRQPKEIAQATPDIPRANHVANLISHSAWNTSRDIHRLSGIGNQLHRPIWVRRCLHGGSNTHAPRIAWRSLHDSAQRDRRSESTTHAAN